MLKSKALVLICLEYMSCWHASTLCWDAILLPLLLLFKLTLYGICPSDFSVAHFYVKLVLLNSKVRLRRAFPTSGAPSRFPVVSTNVVACVLKLPAPSPSATLDPLFPSS